MQDFISEFSAQLAAAPQTTKKTPQPEGQLTVDVLQDDDNIIIQSAIAGVTSAQLDISITNDMVTIKGRRPRPLVDPNRYYHQELYWGPFSRSIILPVDVDPDGVKASMKNGLLTITIPKLEKLRTKRIKISE